MRAAETAVVAGVGPGLGRALVDAFAAEGYRVFAAARRVDALERIPFALPDRVEKVACDVTDESQVDRLLDLAVAVAIFNAGAYAPGRVLDVAPADFERCWRVGCFGGFLLARAAARVMVPRRRGTILFTGATAALRGSAGFANLAVPKFGLRALAQSLARELMPHGIHVAHLIIDGQIRSERYEPLLAQRGPDSLLEPEAIAANYVALHRQPRNAWTGELDLRPWVERF
jgi:NAD(P)-dependent dehydrogenase (short-subunit alcohol dehydrogenase family)